MKQFLAFIQKEFYHIFRDKRTVLILLVMPILQIVLFGFAITTEVKNVKIAVFDPSNDLSTTRIINRLDASEYFNVYTRLSSSAEIEQVFREGKVILALVFNTGFNDDLLHTGQADIQVIADATDPNQATLAVGYAGSIIAAYQQELTEFAGIPVQIVPEVKMLYNPQMKSAYNFVPGVMGLILMLICAMMTAIAIVREKEMGTMEVLLASPVRPIYIILAKAIPYFTLSIINLATILLLSVFVLGVPIAGSLFWLSLLSLLFILVALTLGLMISTLVSSQVAAMMISGIGLMMPVMIFSGMMFPIESMPAALRWIPNFIPAKWYIEGVRKLMIEGTPVIYVWKEFAALSVMAVVLLVVSLKKFQIRLS